MPPVPCPAPCVHLAALLLILCCSCCQRPTEAAPSQANVTSTSHLASPTATGTPHPATAARPTTAPRLVTSPSSKSPPIPSTVSVNFTRPTNISTSAASPLTDDSVALLPPGQKSGARPHLPPPPIKGPSPPRPPNAAKTAASCRVSFIGSEVNISCVGAVSMARIGRSLPLKVKHSGVAAGDERCRLSGRGVYHTERGETQSIWKEHAISMVTLCSAAQVFTLDSAVVQGVNISNLYAEQSGLNMLKAVLAGVVKVYDAYVAVSLVASGSVVVSNGVFAGNEGVLPLLVRAHSDVQVVGSNFTANHVEARSDGMFPKQPVLWVIASGKGSLVSLRNSTFLSNNVTTTYGENDRLEHTAAALIQAASSCTVRVANCSFVDNLAGGVEIRILANDTSLLLHDNMFKQNSGTGAHIEAGDEYSSNDHFEGLGVVLFGTNYFQGCGAGGLIVTAQYAAKSLVVITGTALFADNVGPVSPVKLARSVLGAGGLTVNMREGDDSRLWLGGELWGYERFSEDVVKSPLLRPLLHGMLGAAVAAEVMRHRGELNFTNNTGGYEGGDVQDQSVVGGISVGLSGSKLSSLYMVGPINIDNNTMQGLGSGSGGLFVDISNCSICSLQVHGVQFNGNVGGALGVDVSSASSVDLVVNASTFSGNVGTGLKGGAMLVNFGSGSFDYNRKCLYSQSTLWLADVEFKHNRAEVGSGGAIYVESVACGHANLGSPRTFSRYHNQELVGEWELGLRDTDANRGNYEDKAVQASNVRFVNNSAKYGGALYTSRVPLFFQHSEFRDNEATVFGGGAYLTTTMGVALWNVSFINNRASQHGGGIYSTAETTFQASSKFFTSSSSFTRNTAAGQGGGMYLMGVNATLFNSSFVNNTAYQGGAIMLSSNCPSLGLNIHSTRAASQCGLSLNDTRLEKNIAYVGGGIFLERGSDRMGVTDVDQLKGAAPSSVNRARFSSGVSVAPTEIRILPPAAAAAGSSPVETATELPAAPPTAGATAAAAGGVVFSAASSTDAAGIIPLEVDVGVEGAQVQVTFCKDEGVEVEYLTGSVTPSNVSGLAVFSGLRMLKAQHGRTYCARVWTPNYPDVAGVNFAVRIRGCLAGEDNVDGNCIRCIPGQYNFRPGTACKPCEANANCTGGAVLFPNDGYWHSSYNSANIQLCPNRNACYGTARDAARSCQSDLTCDKLGSRYSDQLCSKGYRGKLCGSCRQDQGYAQGQYFRCSKCMPKGVIILVIGMLGVAAAALICFIAWQNMQEGSRAALLTDAGESATNGVSCANPTIPALSPHAPNRSSAASATNSQSSTPPNSSAVNGSRDTLNGHHQLSNIGHHAPLLGTQQGCPQQSAASSNELTEGFKVLALHLQYLSIISNLLVDWPVPALKLGDVAQLMVAAGSSSTATLDCFRGLGNGGKMMLSVALPLVIVALSSMLAAAGFNHTRQLKSRVAVSDCVIVTCMVGMFLFYSTLASISLSAFSCIQVDGRAYWVQDMDVRCWSPSHLRSSLAVGVTGCLLLCVVIPVLTISWLVANKGKLDDPGFKVRYGFLYKLYRRQYCYWEGVICLQTIAVVAADLFLRQQGTRYQLLLLAAVLIANVLLVSTVHPFQSGHLANLHTISMACLLLNVVVASFLGDYQLSSKVPRRRVRVVVSVVMLVVHVSFVGYCLLVMVASGARAARRMISTTSVRDMVQSVRLGCKQSIQRLMDVFQSDKGAGRPGKRAVRLHP